MQFIPTAFSEVATTKLSIAQNMPTQAASIDVISCKRDRYCLLISNTGDKTVYWGCEDVNESGIPIVAGESLALFPRKAKSVYVYCNANTEIVIAEFFE